MSAPGASQCQACSCSRSRLISPPPSLSLFTEVETEAQRGELAWPGLCSQGAAALGAQERKEEKPGLVRAALQSFLQELTDPPRARLAHLPSLSQPQCSHVGNRALEWMWCCCPQG